MARASSELPAVASGAAATLVAALVDPARYPHPVRRVELIQTHISWVLLTGSYAYKIKKPVNLGFLDFTTLAARRHYCAEELRLNRRLAHDLYLDVVPITGTAQHPIIGGDGPAIEYAVKMKEFGQAALLDNAVARGKVSTATIEQLARRIADFHAQLTPQAAAPGHDANASVLAPARENFAQMLPLLDAPADIATLAVIRDWMLGEYAARATRFQQRYADGGVRECHGDLHLGNVVLLDGVAVPFDCLEFNPALRWMDVISEVAFLMMDLEAHCRRDLAFAFGSAYLETTGDYGGAGLLPFYIVYRAIVRAKINLIRAIQPEITPAQRRRAMDDYQRYITLAAEHTRGSRGAIVITHGHSGSGKTTLTQRLVGALGALRVRSDVERKRLHGLPSLARTNATTGAGIYTGDENVRTYDSLRRHARNIAGAGLPVIVDAAFLALAQRTVFHALAVELGVPFIILQVAATPAELRARVSARTASGGDASDANLQVLEAQLWNCEALTAEEMRQAVLATTHAANIERALCDELARRIRVPGNIAL